MREYTDAILAARDVGSLCRTLLDPAFKPGGQPIPSGIKKAIEKFGDSAFGVALDAGMPVTQQDVTDVLLDCGFTEPVLGVVVVAINDRYGVKNADPQ